MTRTLTAALVAVALIAGAGAMRVEAGGLTGKYQALPLEVAYALESHQTRVRLVLATGEALDLDLPDAEAVERTMDIAAIVARGGRAWAAFDAGQLRTLFVAVGQPGE